MCKMDLRSKKKKLGSGLNIRVGRITGSGNTQFFLGLIPYLYHMQLGLKKNCVFPLTRPSLFWGADPKLFFGRQDPFFTAEYISILWWLFRVTKTSVSDWCRPSAIGRYELKMADSERNNRPEWPIKIPDSGLNGLYFSLNFGHSWMFIFWYTQIYL